MEITSLIQANRGRPAGCASVLNSFVKALASLLTLLFLGFNAHVALVILSCMRLGI
jgi:hypothetical protein